MLNEMLYKALVDVYGSDGVEIRDKDQAGSFVIEAAEQKSSLRSDMVLARMDSWGEKYLVNCPVCNDHGKHLAICHRWNTRMQHPSRKKGYLYFNPYHINCWKCGSAGKQAIVDWLRKLPLPPDYQINAVQLTAGPKIKQAKDSRVLAVEVPAPTPSYSLLDPERTPESVRNWVKKSRGFEPHYLDAQFGVRYVPPGTPFMARADGTIVRTWDERLLIPIVQHRVQISWQLRAAHDEDKETKYIGRPNNPDWVPKGRWLYNFDTALLYQCIMLFEGVTNVWRFGEPSIAMFGKAITLDQIDLMKAVWGFDGKCIIALDEDTWEDKETHALKPRKQQLDIRTAELLLQEKAFKNGVAILRLRGGDAADHDPKRVRYLYHLARKKAVTDATLLDSAILDEKDVGPTPDEVDDFCFREDGLLQQTVRVETMEDDEDAPSALITEGDE